MAWKSQVRRQQLKDELISMLMHDPDLAAQAMGEYLIDRNRSLLADKERQDFLISDGEFPQGETYLEDYGLYRAHKRIERCRKLVLAVKKTHGYTCAICRFNFERAYGEVGRNFIEAHHLVPVASRKGQHAELNPRMDFVVLCSNCHRMIHRSGLPSDVGEFRRQHTRPRYLQRLENGSER